MSRRKGQMEVPKQALRAMELCSTRSKRHTPVRRLSLFTDQNDVQYNRQWTTINRSTHYYNSIRLEYPFRCLRNMAGAAALDKNTLSPYLSKATVPQLDRLVTLNLCLPLDCSVSAYRDPTRTRKAASHQTRIHRSKHPAKPTRRDCKRWA